MKNIKRTVVILTLALALSSFTTGCGGCGTDNQQNMDDMVESTPAATEEGIMEDDTAATVETTEPVTDPAITDNGGNATANDITGNGNYTLDENGNYVDENGNIVDENGNLLDDAGNIVSDAGNAVGDAIDNVGDAADEVVDGVGDGVKDITR